MAETYTFQAEIRQLLYTLVHSLYTEREIFLRELLSNASDALNRIQFELLTNRNGVDPDAPLAIHITLNKKDKTLTISDSGIGMTREEMIENLGTISKSGVAAFLQKTKSTDTAISTDLIGQFGVGFYSIFMVADEVHVISRAYDTDAQAMLWISRGEESYQIEPTERAFRGTDVILHLKEDAEEFLNEHQIRNIVRKHSNYIAFPITISTINDEDEDADEAAEVQESAQELTPINDQQALWRRAEDDIQPNDYQNFYRSLTLDFKEPLLNIHVKADAPVQYYALLFIPNSAERNMFSPRQEAGLQLYARKILIQDYSTDLLPEYLQFVQGVVDCEDLPLNVSRETVQANRVMAQLKKSITGRVLRDLKDLAGKDPEKYATFWNAFGPYLKQGVLTDSSNKDRLLPLLRFYSTQSEDQLTSLQDYVERMQEISSQEEIYYVLGDSKSVAAQSPHLEPFRERGIEVLYFTEVVDSFLINALFDYNDHKLRNVDDEKLDLEAIGSPQSSEAPADTIEDDILEQLRSRFADTLKDKVHSVRISKVLTGRNPARLVSPEGTLDRHTQRVYQMLDREYEVPRKILEINPHHPLMHNLANLLPQDSNATLAEAIIEQVFENALLLDGLHPNPAEMVARIQILMEAATRTANH